MTSCLFTYKLILSCNITMSIGSMVPSSPGIGASGLTRVTLTMFSIVRFDDETTNILSGSCALVGGLFWVWQIVGICHAILFFQPIFSTLESPSSGCGPLSIPLVLTVAFTASLESPPVALARYHGIWWHAKSCRCFGLGTHLCTIVQTDVGVLAHSDCGF